MVSPKNVLTIGPEFSSPKGGVAQCLSTYKASVFSDFRTIVNSREGSKVEKYWIMIISIIKLFLVLCIDKRIKIVHIHSASYNSFRRSSLYVKVAKMMKRKVIIHIHGGGFKEYYSKENVFVDSVFQKCDALIALSESWKKFFVNTVGCKVVYVVPNIIDNPVSISVKKDDCFHLLFLGQILKAKGIFDLVEVLAENRKEYEGKLVLDIGGGMYEEEKLKEFLQRENLDTLINFHGWVSGDMKIKLLNLADSFILPSYVEGVPISILEAESYGVPILSTIVGGIPEIVTDGDNGLLFKPGDKVAIKEAIDKVLYNQKLRKKMGAYSKERSNAHLPKNIKKILCDIYTDLIEEC